MLLFLEAPASPGNSQACFSMFSDTLVHLSVPNEDYIRNVISTARAFAWQRSVRTDRFWDCCGTLRHVNVRVIVEMTRVFVTRRVRGIGICAVDLVDGRTRVLHIVTVHHITADGIVIDRVVIQVPIDRRIDQYGDRALCHVDHVIEHRDVIAVMIVLVGSYEGRLRRIPRLLLFRNQLAKTTSIAKVDRAKNVNGWSDHECLSRVANCLRGDAKTWICEWVTNDRTWSNFKREFKPLCPVKLDFANILYDAMNNTSDKYTTYAEYARRALLRLRIVQGNRAPYQKSHPAPKSRHQPAPGNHVNINCFTCGQRGHRRRDCPKRPRLPTDSNANSNKPSYSNHRNDQCTFCKKPGHSEDKCFAKNRSELRNERSVNLCKEQSNYSQSNDITTAVVCGVPMDVLIDSGALNVSFVSTAVLKHFSCQTKFRHCILKGIGDKEVVANSFITVTLEFDNISIETDLVVVPASLMVTPIIIGTDVLNHDGVIYVRTKDRQYLSRTEHTTPINTVSRLDQIDVNTPLLGKERDALLGVIDDFCEHLITGTAQTTVTTGEMEIKLTSITPVVYRPYKLSYQEKLKVREITRDLLDP
ncbi:hypothetical protein EVAR_78067_1 [Eumeta japonica]|uniref:CCHC-type domain-containing protein n=1 Tax=Eumeta variegata TaxID=151549 RepID=A0A4C1T3R9_EUMVA|nr:hypothetical protein EVAR_78067_1 [Eumeta japonica]